MPSELQYTKELLIPSMEMFYWRVDQITTNIVKRFSNHSEIVKNTK